MNKQRSKTRNSNDLSSREADSVEAATSGSPLTQRPRSLSMGPSVILANACGEREARAIVAEWRPKFKCTVVMTLPEHVDWT